MKRTSLYSKISTLVLIAFFISCQSEVEKPLPKKVDELSEGKYNKYLNLLKEAYITNSNFDAAIQLANLKANPKTTYEFLNLSIKEDITNCDKIYEWYWLYDRHNFGVNLLKLDTNKFKMSIELCDELSNTNSYFAYASMKDEEERQYEENKEVEDSTNFDMKLVAELKQIHIDDQDVRNRLNEKSITPQLEKAIRKES